jgi:hypothetical protein
MSLGQMPTRRRTGGRAATRAGRSNVWRSRRAGRPNRRRRAIPTTKWNLGTTTALRLLAYTIDSAFLQAGAAGLLTPREQHASKSYTQVIGKAGAMLEGDIMKTFGDRVGGRFGHGGWHYSSAEENNKRDVKVHNWRERL